MLLTAKLEAELLSSESTKQERAERLEFHQCRGHSIRDRYKEQVLLASQSSLQGGNWLYSTENLRFRETQQEVETGAPLTGGIKCPLSHQTPKVNGKKKNDQSPNATHILHFLEANARLD